MYIDSNFDLSYFINMTEEEVLKEESIGLNGWTSRFMKPGYSYTCDYCQDRLNFRMKDGLVERVTIG